MVQLGHLAKRNVRSLSGGQQQRIALARALVVEPTLLLLDEPLSNLDAKLRESMRTEIRAIQQRTHATTLFVTHDQDEALDMADRVAVMYKGVIEQFGSPTEVYERPRTKFVVNFIGQANILPCQVGREISSRAGEHSYEIVVDGLGSFGSLGEAGMADSRREVVIRPHRMEAVYGEELDRDRPSGTITHVSYTGDLIAFTLDLAGQKLHVQEPTRHTVLPRVGDRVQVAWHPQDAYLLPQVLEAG
jgi:putative spermidine/putrescine transport system ATP-binding protein